LKLGNFGFCLGAEKKDESDFDSFTVAVGVAVGSVDGFPSFFTTTEGRDVDAEETALFFAGGPTFDATSGSLRFFCFASAWDQISINP